MTAVSVACTVLNERNDIDSLVESLTRQTLAPAEVIVVDGGSTDGTWERLEAARLQYPTLVPIRDESCSLKSCPGPIARGRNVGIAAATSAVVACADAGCTYHPDWLANLTAPILNGGAEYSVGGSYIDPDPARSTIWDVASAPFKAIRASGSLTTTWAMPITESEGFPRPRSICSARSRSMMPIQTNSSISPAPKWNRES